MNVLGLNLYFHDSSAVLLRGGRVVAAIEEERWYRDDKHTRVFPMRSIRYCMQHAGDDDGDLHVAINMQPSRCMRDAPSALSAFLTPWHWKRKHWANYFDRRKACNDTREHVRLALREIGILKEFHYHLVPHHDAHAASTFFVSPFEEAAVLTVDANGEWPTTTLGIGRGNRLQRLQTAGLPNSIGGVYASITEHLGFRRNNDEFKVMGLAALGDPDRYLPAMRRLLRATSDGLFAIDLRYFGYLEYKITPSPAIAELLQCSPRSPGGELTQQHMDIAAALQAHTEDVLVHIARHLHSETGMKRLCMAGGVALNCVMNTALLERTEFDELFVQPASNDAGAALGAATWVQHQLLGSPRCHVLDRVDLGPEYSDEVIEGMLTNGRLVHHRSNDVARDVAKLLAQGNIVGWFQGRAEFGPRALGHRSILADPTLGHMQDHLNGRVKHREDFRPFAPAAPEERYEEYFEAHGDDRFMTRICHVRPEFRERLPAITHVDGTARLQTVSPETNPVFHRLLLEFERERGLPILVNTSFNVNGEPMVLTPADALRCFMMTGIDYLALGNFIIRKTDLSE